VLVGREVEVHLAALQVGSNNVFRLRTRMYSVDFTMGFIENTCFIIHMWILGYSEETGAMGVESKWVLFLAKKRSAARMSCRFIVRTTFVREAKGKFKYADYSWIFRFINVKEKMLTTNAGDSLLVSEYE